MRIATFFCLLVLLKMALSGLPCQAKETEEYYQRILVRYLQGENALASRLINNLDALPVLERYLQPSQDSEKQAKPADVEALIKQLGAEKFSKREEAAQQLMKTLPGSKGKLQVALSATTDLEVRWRLKRLLAIFDGNKDEFRGVETILSSIYASHMTEIWEGYFDLLRENPRDYRVLLFLRNTNTNELVTLVRDKLKPEDELRFYLALKYVGNNWNRLTEQMYKFTGEEIIQAATETYWPVELQSLKKDGTYHWSVRCERIEGQRAVNVLKFCIDQNIYDFINSKPVVKNYQTGRTEPPGNMVHLDTWPRWDYLFRFEKPYVQTYDGVILRSHYTGYFSCEVVQTIPKGLKLETVSVPYRIQQSLSSGSHYLFAKKYYPADLVEKIRTWEQGESSVQVEDQVVPVEQVKPRSDQGPAYE